jgi:hypothetical protein
VSANIIFEAAIEPHQKLGESDPGSWQSYAIHILSLNLRHSKPHGLDIMRIASCNHGHSPPASLQLGPAIGQPEEMLGAETSIAPASGAFNTSPEFFYKPSFGGYRPDHYFAVFQPHFFLIPIPSNLLFVIYSWKAGAYLHLVWP